MATIEEAAATTARLRAAVEAGDVDRLMQAFAPDVVLHSPLTDSLTFDGADAVRGLMPHVLAVVRDIRYTDDVGDEQTRALFYTARIAGVEVEEATRVRLTDDAKIVDITLWFRPLPGLTALMAALGPRLAETPGRRSAVKAMTAPLAAMTRHGDRVAVKFVTPPRQRRA